MSGKNSILGLSEPNESRISWYFYTYEQLKFHAQTELSMEKVLIPHSLRSHLWSMSSLGGTLNHRPHQLDIYMYYKQSLMENWKQR